jgi:glycosyltransferase involved in cell wall biosynthesis
MAIPSGGPCPQCAREIHDEVPATVLVPVHNAGPYLRPAVDSVLAQTFSDFELILVDDGSSDGCLGTLSDLCDRRIRVFQQEQRGAPAALNAGLARARGSIVAFLDHDDLWLPEKLATHMQCFWRHSEIDLTFDLSRMIGENGEDLALPSRYWEGTISLEQLVEDFIVGNTSSLVVRKNVLDRVGAFNESYRRVYDTDLCWRVAALRPGNCYAVPQYLTRYRRHTGQMSRDWREVRREWEDLLRQVPHYPPRPLSGILPVADSNMRRYFAALACEQRDSANALKLALSAFSRAPRRAFGDARNWMMLAAAVGSALLPQVLFERALAWGKARFRSAG